MITPSGVQFETTPKGWRAVLPSGTYLPEPVVLEQGEHGLSAHLEAPLDQNFVFPCERAQDGTILVELEKDARAQLQFHPTSLDYGVRSSHTEGYRANGNWFYDSYSGDRTYHAERTPTGELSGSLTRGRLTVPMSVEMSSHRLSISEDKTPLRQRIAEHGFFSGLKLALDCFTSGSLNTFFFRERYELFPNLTARAANLRAEMEASEKTAHKMVRPPEKYSGVRVTDESVSVGGVVLKRATRVDANR
jgi:hypothetical protein